jgi:hypothetical protein
MTTRKRCADARRAVAESVGVSLPRAKRSRVPLPYTVSFLLPARAKCSRIPLRYVANFSPTTLAKRAPVPLRYAASVPARTGEISERGDPEAGQRPALLQCALRRALAFCAVVAVVVGGVSGCATPGPLHVYALADAAPAMIRDDGPDHAADTPSFLEPGDRVIGFAYDPFTDHFFLRLAPGDRFRVVDRPARKIKREFVIPELAAADGETGDLAVRPRDGHLFTPHPHKSALIEITRYGKVVGEIPLAGFATPPLAVAIDPAAERFFTLRVNNGAARLCIHAMDGKLLGEKTLTVAIAPHSLAFDDVTHELFAPLASGEATGVFDADGRLLRTIPGRVEFVDVGPRSFLRVF